MTEQEIAAYQEALLESLYKSKTVEEVLMQLKNDSRFKIFSGYMDEIEVEYLEVAIELTKKWARSMD
jgi:hypothetical protein